MAEPTDFRRSEDNGVLTVTFTRDAKLNAVTPAMIDGLRAAVDDLGDRDDLKVLVIAAEGRYFSAGIDLADSGAGGRRGYAPDGTLQPAPPAARLPQFPPADGRARGHREALGARRPRALPRGRRGDRRVLRLPAGRRGRQLRAAGTAQPRRDTGIRRHQPGDQAGRTALGQVAGVRRGGIGGAGAHHGAGPCRVPGRIVPRAGHRVRAQARGPADEAAGVTKTAVDIAASVDRGTARDFDRYANTILLTSDEHQSMLEAFKSRKRPPRARPREQAD